MNNSSVPFFRTPSPFFGPFFLEGGRRRAAGPPLDKPDDLSDNVPITGSSDMEQGQLSKPQDVAPFPLSLSRRCSRCLS